MQSLALRLEFGIKKFKSFRKKLPADFKTDQAYRKNPHSLPIGVKEQLLKAKKGGDWKQIRQLERQSLTPYGRFGKHGFVFQKDKLPTYDIPNIDGFELRPYVEFMAPKVSGKLLHHQRTANLHKLFQLKKQLREEAKGGRPELTFKSSLVVK